MLLGFLFIVLMVLWAWSDSSSERNNRYYDRDRRWRYDDRYDYRDRDWDDRYGQHQYPYPPYPPPYPQYPPPYPGRPYGYGYDEGPSLRTTLMTILFTIIAFSIVAAWVMNKLDISFKTGEGQKTTLLDRPPKGSDQPPAKGSTEDPSLVYMDKPHYVQHGVGDLAWAREIKATYPGRMYDIFRTADHRYAVGKFLATMKEVDEILNTLGMRQEDAFAHGLDNPIYYGTGQICAGTIVRNEHDDIWYCKA